MLGRISLGNSAQTDDEISPGRAAARRDSRCSSSEDATNVEIWSLRYIAIVVEDQTAGRSGQNRRASFILQPRPYLERSANGTLSLSTIDERIFP